MLTRCTWLPVKLQLASEVPSANGWSMGATRSKELATRVSGVKYPDPWLCTPSTYWNVPPADTSSSTSRPAASTPFHVPAGHTSGGGISKEHSPANQASL